MTATIPAIAGWFTDGDQPRLLGSACEACSSVYFPPTSGFCRNPACSGEAFTTVELSPRGTVWSYTDAQYQPPSPYIPQTDPYEPFALAAVELPEGIVVLGQVARGYGVADLKVGATVELVVEPLYDLDGTTHTIWRWRPMDAAAAAGSEA